VGSVFEFNERRVIYSFQSKRHWHPGQASLPFLAILVGIIIAIFLLSIFNRTWWLRRHNANGKAMAADRIPPMIVGISLLLGGLVWFGLDVKSSSCLASTGFLKHLYWLWDNFDTHLIHQHCSTTVGDLTEL
jgi:hypothetical protein